MTLAQKLFKLVEAHTSGTSNFEFGLEFEVISLRKPLPVKARMKTLSYFDSTRIRTPASQWLQLHHDLEQSHALDRGYGSWYNNNAVIQFFPG